MSDPRFWAYLLSYSLGALPLGFVVYSASLYLNRALGESQKTIGAVLWIPPLGSEIGVFFWGWLADRMAKHPHQDSMSCADCCPPRCCSACRSPPPDCRSRFRS